MCTIYFTNICFLNIIQQEIILKITGIIEYILLDKSYFIYFYLKIKIIMTCIICNEKKSILKLQMDGENHMITTSRIINTIFLGDILYDGGHVKDMLNYVYSRSRNSVKKDTYDVLKKLSQKQSDPFQPIAALLYRVRNNLCHSEDLKHSDVLELKESLESYAEFYDCSAAIYSCLNYIALFERELNNLY